jgi:hypothetical protein
VKYEFLLELYFSYRSGQNVIINVSPQEMRQNKELNHTQVRKRYVSVNTAISLLLRGEGWNFLLLSKNMCPAINFFVIIVQTPRDTHTAD